MMRRRDALITLGALVAAAGGPRLGRAQEARPRAPKLIEPPFFAPKIEKKELPPVAERVPRAPAIVKLGDGKEPGRYGGDLRLLMTRERDARFMVVYGYARLVAYDENLVLVPDLCQRFTVEANRIFTFFLRRGHRWSDGAAFTSADFRYYWEDMLNNEILVARIGFPQDLVVDGEKPKVEFPDATTVRYAWSKANPRFMPALAAASPLYIYRASRYLRRYHVKYATKERLEEIKRRFKGDPDGWVREHIRRDRMYRNTDPRQPTLDPWKLDTTPPAQRLEFHRNPYFHRIDEAGHQLPYIDRVVMVMADSKIIAPKSGAGESDLQARNLRFDDYTFLKRAAAQRGGFSVRLWKTASGAQLAFYPNLNVADESWRALMRDVRFRRALSLGIDRDDVNRVMYLGQAVPGANTVLPGSPLYKPALRAAWSKHDRAAANALLDEIGLARQGGDGVRRMKSGQELELIVEYPSEGTEYSDSLRLIGENWAKIGIKLFSKATRRELLRRRVMAGSCMMSYWGGLDYALIRPEHSPREFAPHQEDQPQWPRWGLWAQLQSQKDRLTPEQIKRAEEPEGAARELVELDKAWFMAASGEERRRAWERILEIWADQVYTIGVVGGLQQPVVVSARLRNVPAEGVYAFEPGAHFGIYRPDTFWFADAPPSGRSG
jgi:peptide/nickel transport system substrate-binding protein